MTSALPYAELIGDPVAHSKSPLIHCFWLEKLGIDADYRATRVSADGLADYFAARRADPDWRGCNVTMPLKLAVLDHVADHGGLAESIGAANTILAQSGGPAATNTDAAGFFASLSDVELDGMAVAMVGAGGAARAALFALSRCSIGKITILARNPLKAAMLLSTLGMKGETLPLDAALPPAELLVNASPLGMTGHDPYVPDLSRLKRDAIVYDLVYDPVDTPLLVAAGAAGLDTIDGLEMLVAQAAVAFELIFGVAPPREYDGDLRKRLMA